MNKTLLTTLLPVLLYSSAALAQQPALPVVKATSAKASIRMTDRPAKSWNIDAREALDIFTTPKLNNDGEQICFRTDTDSIVFCLRPGRQQDFIVLLNGKDSCRTRIQAPEPKNYSTSTQPEIHDTIPLYLNEHNTLYVAAVLNGTDTLWLNFDSGSSDITLTNQTLEHKTSPGLQLYNKLQDLQIGTRHYKSAVYPAELTAHGTDGRFGWDLFDGYVVELNYDRQIMVIHSRMPEGISRNRAFTTLRMHYIENIFIVDGCRITHRKSRQQGFFLFDSGYERTAMLDRDLLDADHFPVAQMKVIKKVMMRGAKGNEVPVITASLDRLSLGSYSLQQVPVQVQNANKPMQGLNLHILGNEVLKRFNTFLDFQQNKVYLQPNKHFSDNYIEAG